MNPLPARPRPASLAPRARACALWLGLGLAGCATVDPAPPYEPGEPTPGATAGATGPTRLLGATATGPTGNRVGPASAARTAAGPPEIVMGTGRFVDPTVRVGTPPPAVSGGDVTLDFANVDIRDVLRGVLGDLLRVSYVVDPTVQGAITLQTGRPVPRSALLDVLSSALQVNGLALVARDGLYRVVPLANATREAPVSGGAAQGFVTRVMTPRFVAATDIEKALEQVLPSGASLRADPGRNVLIVSGQARDVADLLGMVESFDVDYLRGLSFALLPLRTGRARDVAADVSAMIAASGRGLPDLVKVVPIQRMNAVLVTSMQPAYLGRVRGWVEKLDRGDGRGEQQLYVYRVQNGRAADLAGVLRRALGIEAPETVQPAQPPNGQEGLYGAAGGRGGGLAGGSLLAGGAGAGGALSGGSLSGGSLSGGLMSARPLPQADPLASVGAAAAGGGAPGMFPPGMAGPGYQPVTDIRVTADVTNNALIIAATAQEYARIESALERLDIVPLQVLIEATIAEVTLTNQLNFGLQYFFKSGGFAAVFSPAGIRTGAQGNDATTSFPGFSLIPGANFAFTTSSGSSVVLQALSQLTSVRVLSSPNLMVLNNRSARLQVGDQVPIATQSSVSTITPNAPQVNSIDYRDTGVILTVTPRVNASGLVLLDIAEEVSEVTPTTSSSLNSPTISQRRVTSSVAAMDGQTIGLGGLIRDSRGASSDGVPVLKDIPVLGYLFGARSNAVTRTELIVLITPHVVRGRDDSDAITRELRDRLALTAPTLGRRGR